MSNKAKFWIGVVVALPAMIVAGIISGAGSAVVDAVGGDPAVGASVSGAIGLALLGGFVTPDHPRAHALDRARDPRRQRGPVHPRRGRLRLALLIAYSNSYG